MPVSNERSGRRRRLSYVAGGGPCSARKVITLGYEGRGYNMVMKGLCYCATGGCSKPRKLFLRHLEVNRSSTTATVRSGPG
jgi:hypothetical protein